MAAHSTPWALELNQDQRWHQAPPGPAQQRAAGAKSNLLHHSTFSFDSSSHLDMKPHLGLRPWEASGYNTWRGTGTRKLKNERGPFGQLTDDPCSLTSSKNVMEASVLGQRHDGAVWADASPSRAEWEDLGRLCPVIGDIQSTHPEMSFHF